MCFPGEGVDGGVPRTFLEGSASNARRLLIRIENHITQRANLGGWCDNARAATINVALRQSRSYTSRS